MDHERRAGRHPDLDRAAEEARRGRMSRRGFLRVAALLGAGVGIGAAASRLQHRGALAVEPAAGAPRTGGTLRCAMSVFDIADPARFAWVEMSNQARHQHEHLTVTGPDNITRPMLAERWAAADDLKTWTFHLRRGVRWHSGDPFTADDVAFNIARWLDPELGSSTLALFSGLTGAGAGVEVVDPHTLRLHLSAPLLSVPENFYNYPTALVHRGFSGDVTRDRNGTGPYQIVENAPGEISISRRRTAGDQPYWGAAVPHVGPGLLDEIRYVHHEAASPEAVEAVISGAVDMCYEVGVESFERAAEAPETRLLVADSALTGCLRMRVDAAPFDDVRVRRAIQLCCDAEAYPDQVFSGRGRPGEHHHVARIHPDYFPLDPPPRDAAQARRLLAEAGFADGLDLTLDVGNTSGLWQQRTAELFARQASEAGVRVRVN
ncbi:MAG: ABC transporter substrate-binding protein, partial [Pseudomonadota bacterium]